MNVPTPPPAAELDATERAAFDALPRTVDVPAGLADRVAHAVLGSLAESAARRAARRRRILATAATVLLVVSAYLLGRVRAGGVRPLLEGSRYVLLLRETGVQPARDDRSQVSEYRDWANRMARGGKLELGEKLADEGAVVAAQAIDGRVPAASGVVTGFFIVTARSLQEAMDIARSCPHLRHGGSIEVRRIIET